jgi:tetratricopeptide (TPR) repeat protein
MRANNVRTVKSSSNGIIQLFLPTVLALSVWLPTSAAEYSTTGAAALAKNGQWSQLVSYAKKWIELEPHNPEAWYSLGNAWGSKVHKTGMQQPKMAQPAYQEAVKLNRHFAAGWNALGQTSLEIGNRYEAVRALTKATELEPANKEFWKSLGSAYSMGANPNRSMAASCFKKAQSL